MSQGVTEEYLTNLLGCFQHVKMSVLNVDSVEEVSSNPVHEPGHHPMEREAAAGTV